MESDRMNCARRAGEESAAADAALQQAARIAHLELAARYAQLAAAIASVEEQIGVSGQAYARS